ncbi:hypothetical protein A3A03_00670 [Candidatus Nomurabacteria bacterium RIFCSPLOWO2_01_FULL_40_18]|uniref:Right handed beta helix domain-containing protein n=1 Tax=Candidatus Nomurabacteria bacterium RIFCSPLOWO2_01_FULL_40_18 TaxID=1801773 RepID=A0A1F6XII2_9BACT|nr:MAG: hypothetical protein A3A03_00670 [Candidatus Nomurabacteria bacterium RIFCSPLOWO2_01_FULL_40_18]
MSGIKHWGFVFTLFILTSVFYFQPHQASASTIVTNDITTDTTWTLTDSPYVLQNSLYILEGSTLTIEAGVIVKIDGHQGIYVEGSIVTNGTDSLPVTFTSFLDDIGGDTNEDGDSFPFNGDWSEIHVNDPTSGSSFSNTNINYSYGGLAFENTPSISISNLGVNNFVYDGLTLFDDSHAIVDGFSSDGGNDNIAIFNNSSGEFTNVSITNSGSDESVVVFNDSSISIEDGVIENSFGDGIVFFNYSDVSVNNVTLENLFGTALMDIGTNRPDRYPPNSLNISNSIIKNNITGFEFWLPTTALSTSHNSIFGNLAYGVVNYSPDTNYNYNFENNWWGDASGPYNAMSNPAGLGDAVSDNVLFDPWCQNETCAVAPEGFSSVLFLPGLKASRLYAPRADGSEDQLWEPNGNSDVEYLYLNTDGTSRNSNVYTREIIEEANVPIPLGEAGPNIYKSFAHMLYTLFDERKIADWKAFPYDWRQSVDDIVNNGTKYEDGTLSLTDTLESLVDSSLNGKVTIIAHSNGGLLAKALLKKLQDDKTAGRNNLIDSVDVLILVGVPEIGTPEPCRRCCTDTTKRSWVAG